MNILKRVSIKIEPVTFPQLYSLAFTIAGGVHGLFLSDHYAMLMCFIISGFGWLADEIRKQKT